MTALAAAIDVLLTEILSLRQEESLLILTDEEPLEELGACFTDRARDLGHRTEVGVLPPDERFYVEPPASVVRRMQCADVILEMASTNSTYYSKAVKEAVGRGARVFFLSGLGAAEQMVRFMLSVNNTEVHALGQRVQGLLLRSRRIEVLSGSGCALWASLGPPWARELR